MIKSLTLACSALALGLGLLAAPAYAADNEGMSKMSDGAMMHKDGMKKHPKHKDGMMSGNAMKDEGMMKKDEAAPAQ